MIGDARYKDRKSWTVEDLADDSDKLRSGGTYIEVVDDAHRFYNLDKHFLTCYFEVATPQIDSQFPTSKIIDLILGTVFQDKPGELGEI
jgi:hypothetical protein